jgi:hypothetical protein
MLAHNLGLTVTNSCFTDFFVSWSTFNAISTLIFAENTYLLT